MDYTVKSADIKILVVNLHSSLNAGDDILTRISIEQLRKRFGSPVLTLAMNDPESHIGDCTTVGSFMTWIKSPDNGKWHFKGIVWLILSIIFAIFYRLIGLKILKMPDKKLHLLKAYFEADLVISSAGNFLYSSGKLGFPFLVAVYTMAYAWLAGKPIYTMPQSIGPLRRGWERWLTRWIISKIRLVFVRDAISQAELEKIGAWNNNCFQSPDIAFSLKPIPTEQGKSFLQDNGVSVRQRPLLGVTLINWGAQNHLFKGQSVYETAMAQTIRFFVIEYEGQVVLFSQVRGPSLAEDDRIPAQRVKKMLDDLDSQVVLIDQDTIPETLKAAYGQMDLFIGSRLHSNIFALSECVPAIMIQYQYKTRGVVQMLELEKWVIEIEQVTASTLTELLRKLWLEQMTIRTHLQKIIPSIIQQTNQATIEIANDMKRK